MGQGLSSVPSNLFDNPSRNMFIYQMKTLPERKLHSMVPDALTNFFIASAGAGAALLGLLFVSLSISPEEKITLNASVEKRVSAYGALGSLINAFFISLAALIPGNFGTAVLVFGALSFIIAIQSSIQLLRPHEGASSMARRIITTVLNLGVYVAQCYYAVQLILNPHNSAPVYSLTTLLLVVYVLGVFRAWELLGGTRTTALQLITGHQQEAPSTDTNEDTTTVPK
jgi:hypothetical protein